MKLNNNQFINEGANIIECLRQAYKMYKQQTTAEKRRLLNVMFEKMTVKNRIINYTYKKPFCYFAQCNTSNADEIVEFIKQNIILNN
ncbi:MAG: hypothetical protein IJ003_01140 [Candidatus Gastranaerophilales bacterium]|nr:hypothetical protein [Candidatus Gastranaerophilales bacterium]